MDELDEFNEAPHILHRETYPSTLDNNGKLYWYPNKKKSLINVLFKIVLLKFYDFDF